jgi:CMP-N,N'-diacetyllegionaminic acid synthase
MEILGVIPARGGSKEVPRKNLLKLGEKTLVEHAIISAKNSKKLNRVIFSTDDEEISQEAKRVGAEVPFIRPDNLAQDSSSTYSVLRHAHTWLKDNEGYEADVIVLLQPTTPFRKGKHIDGVIDLMVNSKCDAAITITKFGYPPYWSLKMDEKNKLKNIIKDGNLFTRRQDTPQAYKPAGLVYCLKKDFLYNLNSLLPSGDTRGYLINSDCSVNIDTWDDYEYAKWIWNSKKFNSINLKKNANKKNNT